LEERSSDKEAVLSYYVNKLSFPLLIIYSFYLFVVLFFVEVIVKNVSHFPYDDVEKLYLIKFQFQFINCYSILFLGMQFCRANVITFLIITRELSIVNL